VSVNKLLVKAKPGKEIANVTPASAGWGYVGFAAYRLQPGESVSFEDPAREACLVVLAGKAKVQAGSIDCGELGTRASVFDDKAPDAAQQGRGGQGGHAGDVSVHPRNGSWTRLLVRLGV